MQQTPEQAAQKILDDAKEHAAQERTEKGFKGLKAWVDRKGLFRPEKAIDRHYTEAHRERGCRCMRNQYEQPPKSP